MFYKNKNKKFHISYSFSLRVIKKLLSSKILALCMQVISTALQKCLPMLLIITVLEYCDIF
jgi:hypothetical protein